MRRRLTIAAALTVCAGGAIVAPVLAVGNPAAGKTVYTANGCGSCHVFVAARSKGTVGPKLTKASLTAHAKAAKQPLAVYVRTAIVSPNAYVVKGFRRGVMPGTYGKTIRGKKLDDLVAFVARG